MLVTYNSHSWVKLTRSNVAGFLTADYKQWCKLVQCFVSTQDMIATMIRNNWINHHLGTPPPGASVGRQILQPLGCTRQLVQELVYLLVTAIERSLKK